MGCQECAGRGWDHDEIVEACRTSIYETGIVLCKFERLIDSPLHQEIFGQMQEWIDAGEHDILLMLPRDFLKTTFLACCAIWGWINDPELRIYLFHSSSKQSGKMVPMLKRIITDAPMRHFFPQVVPIDTRSVIWKSDEMEVRRQGNYANASIEARGVGSTVTGGHVNWIFDDDIVERGASDSEAEMRAAQTFFQGQSALLDDPKSYLNIVCGTLWRGGFYEELQAQGIYKCLVLGAECDYRYRQFMESRGKAVELEDGDSIWSEHFPDEVLARLRVKMGADYHRQFLNLASEDLEVTFREEDARTARLVRGPQGDAAVEIFRSTSRRDSDGRPEMRRLILPLSRGLLSATCDPATGKKRTSDESAINVSVHYPQDGVAVCLEEWSGNVMPDRLIERIFATMLKWKPHGLWRLGMEEAGQQAFLRHWLDNEMRRRGIHFHIDLISVRNRPKKDRMIDLIQPLFRQHRLFFTRDCRPLVRQLTGIRVASGNLVGRSPNRVDALAMQCQHYFRFTSQSESQDIPFGTPEVVQHEETDRPYGLGCRT